MNRSQKMAANNIHKIKYSQTVICCNDIQICNWWKVKQIHLAMFCLYTVDKNMNWLPLCGSNFLAEIDSHTFCCSVTRVSLYRSVVLTAENMPQGNTQQQQTSFTILI